MKMDLTEICWKCLPLHSALAYCISPPLDKTFAGGKPRISYTYKQKISLKCKQNTGLMYQQMIAKKKGLYDIYLFTSAKIGYLVQFSITIKIFQNINASK